MLVLHCIHHFSSMLYSILCYDILLCYIVYITVVLCYTAGLCITIYSTVLYCIHILLKYYFIMCILLYYTVYMTIVLCYTVYITVLYCIYYYVILYILYYYITTGCRRLGLHCLHRPESIFSQLQYCDLGLHGSWQLLHHSPAFLDGVDKICVLHVTRLLLCPYCAIFWHQTLC